MLHTQEGHFINGKTIEEWKVVPLKKDLHAVVAVGASEHQVHVAPKERCESVQAKIVAEVENGFENTLDFRGFDMEHLEAATKPTSRRTSSKTTKAEPEADKPESETSDTEDTEA